MRYYITALILLVVVVLGLAGFRGTLFTQNPIMIFDDMDNQDKLLAQRADKFFANDQGSRPKNPKLVANHLQFEQPGDAKSPNLEFGEGRLGYYYTGTIDGYYANGMPQELHLDDKSAHELLLRGQERFQVFCSRCHGESGNGQGVTTRFGVPNPANLLADNFKAQEYADGKIYHTIAFGKGNMLGNADRIPVRDRWAIVAYVRALQLSRNVPYVEVKQVFDKAEKTN